jgi:thiamine-monophosphate kinase
MNEFTLIDAYFKSLSERVGGLRCDLGIGDDAALVTVPHGKQLAITTDTLIEGVHFPRETFPADIGYKALAVNLSDLAAMGARPAWFTLCLSLPAFSTAWLESFCSGLEELMRQQPITLIGGDTTRGPLSISIQAMGLVDSGCALRRDTARPGDDIYVSGRIGDAGVGLRVVQQKLAVDGEALQTAVNRLNRPQPRNGLGEALTSLASACIDVSDGLMADMNHLLSKSQVGADIDLERVPIATALTTGTVLARLGFADASPSSVRRFAVSAGDDYELCFTAPPAHRSQIELAAQQAGVTVTRFGAVTQAPGIFDSARGGEMISPLGYSHF